ncbi:unnamed protein product [Vicia faba]|uniref:Uncharacterized protein n=1 Tax=Vicia faba TaxID=3906 RepID=A0AAV0YPN2_VICFA|nr:unnamed protein product [Vicia faba]
MISFSSRYNCFYPVLASAGVFICATRVSRQGNSSVIQTLSSLLICLFKDTYPCLNHQEALVAQLFLQSSTFSTTVSATISRASHSTSSCFCKDVHEPPRQRDSHNNSNAGIEVERDAEIESKMIREEAQYLFTTMLIKEGDRDRTKV